MQTGEVEEVIECGGNGEEEEEVDWESRKVRL